MIITSISGIRGTVGGSVDDNLSPHAVVDFAYGYAQLILEQAHQAKNVSVVIGKDGRHSGSMISMIFAQTLRAFGINIIDVGYAATPTVSFSVRHHQAQGGVIITASHNPKEYNGIKLLNAHGEFLSEEEGLKVLEYNREEITLATNEAIGRYKEVDDSTKLHLDHLCATPLVDHEAISQRNLTVVCDTVNSVANKGLHYLADTLNLNLVFINELPYGDFAHAPEPLEKNLQDLIEAVPEHGADFGIAIDPDGDRIVFVDEKGAMINEEYSQVLVADYVLPKYPKKERVAVTNLSSSMAFDDVVKKHEGKVLRSKVGEKNVVTKMKEHKAVMGGEGSGGIIVPELHYGRDAFSALVLALSYLSSTNQSLSLLRSSYESYVMVKDKVALEHKNKAASTIAMLKDTYSDKKIDTQDGIKIILDDTSWVHVRASNTEPILRIFAEARDEQSANKVITEVRSHIKNAHKEA